MLHYYIPVPISYIEKADVKHTQEDCLIRVVAQAIQKQQEFNQIHAFILEEQS